LANDDGILFIGQELLDCPCLRGVDSDVNLNKPCVRICPKKIRLAVVSYLVRLNRSYFLILLNKVSNLLVKLLQSALADRLGHRRDLDDCVGVCADMVELKRELAQSRVYVAGCEPRDGTRCHTESSIHLRGGKRVLMRLELGRIGPA
jgi:hypothetical protein